MDSESSILVSTVIPTHNRADLLAAAIESAVSQFVPGSHEIIVVDDRSADHTAAIVARYAEVRYLRVDSGLPSRTRNFGIHAARGEYIAFLDDDDVWLDDRLAPALALLGDDPEAGMVYGQASIVGPDLAGPGRAFPALPLAEGHPVADMLETVVHLDTVLIRRSVFDTVGLLDESVFGAEDMDITVRIARSTRVRALQRVLALVRTREGGPPAVGEAAHWIGRARDDIGLLRRHLSMRDRHRPGFARRGAILRRRQGWYTHHLLRIAQRARDAGLNAEARTAALAALRLSPAHALRSGGLYRSLLPR